MNKLIVDNIKWCTGCTACKNVCHKNAIKMVENEAGFKFPFIDNNICDSCGLCQKSCPILKSDLEENRNVIQKYLGYSRNSDILINTASGGIVTELARNMIENGAIIVGAAFDNKFYVKHIICNNIETLNRLSRSKYVQSDIDGIFEIVESYLRDNIEVLFSGTPCQVAGLLVFLNAKKAKNMSKLVTVDFSCHNVPSPKAFELYLGHLKKTKGNIVDVRFKDKKYGYSFPTLAIEFENGQTIYNTSQADPYMRAFLTRRISRLSCFNCKFRKTHLSDITVADFYSSTSHSNNLGISRISVWSEKGMEILNKYGQNLELLKHEIAENDQNNAGLEIPNDYVDFSLLQSMGGEDFFNKFFKVSFRDRAKGSIRKMLYYLKIHDLIKSIYKRVHVVVV